MAEMNETIEMLTTKEKSISLDHLMQSAQEIQDLCEDHTVVDVTNKNLYYNADFNGLSFTTEDGTRHMLQLTPHSMSQLCGKAGVPIRYIQKCITQGMPDLAAENMNAWLDDYHKSLFIRQYGPTTIRGVLSDKYAVMDAPDVVDVLTDTFGTGDYKVRGALLNPERLHLRVVQKEMMNIDGEDLFAGVTIDSSDVGRSTLAVRFFIYKQICKNGMCISHNMGEIYTQRHVGLTKEEFRSELTENLERVPLIVDKITEAIKAASLTTSKAVRDTVDFNKWGEERQQHFQSRIKALTRLPEETILDVVNMMYDKYTVTPWGFMNALTEQAQAYTLERRIELERAAGDILLRPQLIAA